MAFKTRALVVRLAPPLLAFAVAVSPGLPGTFPSARNPLRGATCVPPEDLGELAVLSDAVVVATARGTESARRGILIFTRTELVVEQSLSGPLRPGDEFTVEAPGGEVDGRAWIVTGSPRFAGGSSYFLCLHRKAENLWRPAMLSYGVLEDVPAADGSRLLTPIPDASFAQLLAGQDGLIPEAVATYHKAAFLANVRQVLERGAAWDSSSSVAEVDVRRLRKAPPPQCAFFAERGRRVRWNTFDSGGAATIFSSAPGDESIPGGGFDETVGALDLWMDIPGAGFNLSYGGEVDVAPDCARGEDSEPDVILFNDPCSDISDLNRCTGVLAFGGPLTDGSHRFDGETWETAVGWIVVVNNGAGCLGSSGYRSMLAHELGHGLGFAHVSDVEALMFESCCNNVNVTDRVCAAFAYPARDPVNERPAVNAGEDRRIVLTGSTAFLSGTASDDGLPVGSDLALSWSQLSGPGPVVLGDPAAPETSVSFPRSGVYRFRLTADDSDLIGADYVTVEVETDAGSHVTARFQQELDGYRGTIDTDLKEEDPSADGSRLTELEVDARNPAASDEVHVLLRFDDVFGAGPGQVPPGASIRSAVLTLSSTNFGDGASFHRMIEPWSDQASWSDFDGRGVALGVEALDVVDATASGTNGTVEVDVTASMSAWSEDPCSNHGWALLPRGTNGWHFQSAEGEVPPRLTIDYSTRREETLIAVGDSWSYFKGIEDPPAGWNLPGFEQDERWLEGSSGIGYGDEDDTTILEDMQDGYLTLYARRELSVEAPNSLRRLRLRIDYDDGFIAYLNGEEVARSPSLGVAGAPVDRNTQSDSREAGEAELYELPTAALRAGANVLAVEVHNSSISSSDLSFTPRLQVTASPIDGGDAWSFRRGNLSIPENWNQPGFDDSDWEVGPSPIGYGDGDDRTVLTDMQGNYISVYARRTFEISPAEEASAYGLTVVYDDGVVLYLNGEELGRADLPIGEITPATAATRSGEGERVVFRIERDQLVEGTNLLAASVHNSQLSSSDLTFDAVLAPLRTEFREVDCDAPAFAIRRGDVTDDAAVNIGDAVSLLVFLFESGAMPPCLDAADVDDDGRLSITDSVTLLAHLFSGGSLPAPGEVCGVDPTEDELGDCASAACGV